MNKENVRVRVTKTAIGGSDIEVTIDSEVENQMADEKSIARRAAGAYREAVSTLTAEQPSQGDSA